MYTVNRLKISCECQIQCQDCLSCIHCYTCSCIDSAIKWNMCKHNIYQVFQFQYSISNQENNGMLTNCLVVNNNLNNMPNTDGEHNNETSNILSQLNNSAITIQLSLELEKRKLQESFNKVLYH